MSSLRFCAPLEFDLSRFTEFGGPVHRRPVQDLAFAVARFIQEGGSFINYYMVSYFASFVVKYSIFCLYILTFIGMAFLLCDSTMEVPTLAVLLVVLSSPQVMTMMLLLMNMVRGKILLFAVK